VAYGEDGGWTCGGVSMAVIDDDGINGELNGSLWAWGDNSTGALGIGRSSGYEPWPLRVGVPGTD